MKKIISLNIIVLAAILVFYSVTVNSAYNGVKDNIETEYHAFAFSLENELFTASALTFDKDADGYRNWSCAEEFLNYYNDFSRFPYRIVIYDSNSNEIARTSSILEFDSGSKSYDNVSRFVTYFCKLDEYLTDEQKEFMIGLNGSGNYVKNFGCIVDGEDNQFVKPVYILYQDMSCNDTYKINFSNEEPNAVIDSYNIKLNIVDDLNNKSYDYIDKQIADGIPQSYIDENDTDAGAEGLLYYTKCDEIYIGSERCLLLAVSYIDSDDATLHDDRFADSFKNITVLYLAFTAVILTVLNFYIKHNRLNNAKYVFSNAAAHELKTPLAVIENKCEFILEGVDESKTAEYIKETYKEALRMNTLLNNLLRYNKLSTINRVEKADSNLRHLVEKELEKYSSAAKVKNITFNIELTDAEINCNDELISLAVGNLLSNAIKFSPSDSKVSVILTKFKKKKYKLSVINRFDGVIDKKVWDMLYVSDEARSGKSTGMGLPISKEIFELHRYKYGFKNENGTVEFYVIAK